MLRAISYVFAKERDGLLAELRTHVVTHGEHDESAIKQLEQKIHEMVSSRLLAGILLALPFVFSLKYVLCFLLKISIFF